MLLLILLPPSPPSPPAPSRRTRKHVGRGSIQVRQLRVPAHARVDLLAVEGRVLACDAHPSLLQDGLVDDAHDGDAVVQQRDQGAEQGLAWWGSVEVSGKGIREGRAGA